MSSRGVITSDTVISAIASTPVSIWRSALWLSRGGARRGRKPRSTQETAVSSGRNRVRVPWTKRPSKLTRPGSLAAQSRGARSPRIQTRNTRSEERRVGKERRAARGTQQEKRETGQEER